MHLQRVPFCLKKASCGAVRAWGPPVLCDEPLLGHPQYVKDAAGQQGSFYPGILHAHCLWGCCACTETWSLPLLDVIKGDRNPGMKLKVAAGGPADLLLHVQLFHSWLQMRLPADGFCGCGFNPLFA